MDSASIAAITSGTVAIATIVASEVRHRQSLSHTRKLADLESVRGVLDDGAAALHEAAYAMDDVRVGLRQWGLGFFDDEQRQKPYRALRRSGEKLDRLSERLKVRLGRQNEAVTAFQEADAAVLVTFRAANLVKLEDRPSADDAAAARQVRLFLEEQRDRIDAAREQFDGARDRFVDAAQRAAGAKLDA